MHSTASRPILPLSVHLPEIVYHAVVQGIDDPFNIVDRSFRILWANARKAQLFRKSQNDLIGRFCYEVYQGRQEVCPQCPVRDAFCSGKTCIMETHVTNQSGSSRPCEIRAYPVHDKHGNIVYGITIGFDISARKKRPHGKRQQIRSDQNLSTQETPFSLSSSTVWNEGPAYGDLTDRELEVLRLVASGLTNNDIASTLSISPHTVKSHIIHIFNKLEVNDRTQAAVRGTFLGLI